MSEERSDIQINFERAEVSSEPLTAEQLLLQSLPGLLDFADDYPLYPEMLPFVYKIYRDLYLSGLYENIEILDGQLLNMSIYYFRGKIATKKLSRVLIPFDFDQDVDLQWLEQIAKESESRAEELYLCVGNMEAVMCD